MEHWDSCLGYHQPARIGQAKLKSGMVWLMKDRACKKAASFGCVSLPGLHFACLRGCLLGVLKFIRYYSIFVLFDN